MATLTLFQVDRFAPHRLLPAVRQQVLDAGGSCSFTLDQGRLKVRIQADDDLAPSIADRVSDWYGHWRQEWRASA